MVYWAASANRPIAVGLREGQSDANPIPYDRYAVGIHHVAFRAPSREAVDDRADGHETRA